MFDILFLRQRYCAQKNRKVGFLCDRDIVVDVVTKHFAFGSQKMERFIGNMDQGFLEFHQDQESKAQKGKREGGRPLNAVTSAVEQVLANEAETLNQGEEGKYATTTVERAERESRRRQSDKTLLDGIDIHRDNMEKLKQKTEGALDSTEKEQAKLYHANLEELIRREIKKITSPWGETTGAKPLEELIVRKLAKPPLSLIRRLANERRDRYAVAHGRKYFTRLDGTPVLAECIGHIDTFFRYTKNGEARGVTRDGSHAFMQPVKASRYVTTKHLGTKKTTKKKETKERELGDADVENGECEEEVAHEITRDEFEPLLGEEQAEVSDDEGLEEEDASDGESGHPSGEDTAEFLLSCINRTRIEWIVSDAGKEFVNLKVAELCHFYEIKWYVRSSVRARGNGKSERPIGLFKVLWGNAQNRFIIMKSLTLQGQCEELEIRLNHTPRSSPNGQSPAEPEGKETLTFLEPIDDMSSNSPRWRMTNPRGILRQMLRGLRAGIFRGSFILKKVDKAQDRLIKKIGENLKIENGTAVRYKNKNGKWAFGN